jgi:GxxExxY protein
MKVFEPLAPETESIAKNIVDAALKVHRALGPGLLESVYELCLAHELRRRGLHLESQVKLPITYEGLRIDAGLRL